MIVRDKIPLRYSASAAVEETRSVTHAHSYIDTEHVKSTCESVNPRCKTLVLG